MTSLAQSARPCGPVVDAAAASRARAPLAGDAAVEGWTVLLDAAWPALAPVFAASPYLAGLARRAPGALRLILDGDPDARLAAVLAATETCAADPDIGRAEQRLRALKAELHLLTALADLGGVWDLDQVTGALSAFADAALSVAFTLAAREALAAGKITRLGTGDEGPLPGLFCIAMGKHGAFELNYSSDIDISFFHEPDALALAPGVEAQPFAARMVDRIADILQRRTVEGYVFRVDTRLRPDPSSTPVSVSVPAAFNYYESVGQNWERAAFIKARVAAGDVARGQAFLTALQPFIWRRNLDFAAIADIHSIKRQIHVHKVDDRLDAAGADLKLGRGGIREVEFFVQTQQLILGGRQPQLRSPRTLDALAALAEAGHVTSETANGMAGAYRTLRSIEHRVQMIADEQSHRLPRADHDRARIAALAGYSTLGRFDAAVGKLLKGVNRRYGALFAGEEALSSRFGSLVFTGVEDDAETLATLGRMGFSEPARISGAIRAWHHGRIGATRGERGRELFTRLAPRLLDAVAATGAPDPAFARFADFFAALTAGVQTQSLFLAQPRLLDLVVRVMAFAPRFARTLARRPSALDALLDASFFDPAAHAVDIPAQLVAADDFEGAMNLARRLHAEHAFRIGAQVLSGVADARAAGLAFTDLADDLIGGLAAASLSEIARQAGDFPGEVAVIALGKCGSREMTARSDLDLMTLYRPAAPDGASTIKGWSADVFYARFTQRLVAALSAPTTEGGLYDVDLKLRPSGTKGPVAVSFAAFETYYAGPAETWEFLALTRARVVWATTPAFAAEAMDAIETALRRPRDPAGTARDVADMRDLISQERPDEGFWDMKLREGGLVDIEFCAQYLQLLGGPLRQNTGDALVALSEAEPGRRRALDALHRAWTVQQSLSQLLKIALEDDADVEAEPAAFKALLAKAGGARGFAALKSKLESARAAAHGVFEAMVRSSADQA